MTIPLLRVFSRKRHPLGERIVYDVESKEYYDKRTDIFLTEEEINYWLLRPYSLITNPLPHPLPPDYFTEWSNDAGLPTLPMS